jgi:hypothetical protein
MILNRSAERDGDNLNSLSIESGSGQGLKPVTNRDRKRVADHGLTIHPHYRFPLLDSFIEY